MRLPERLARILEKALDGEAPSEADSACLLEFPFDSVEADCVEACPEKAAIFGDRAELLEEAHRRLRANPEKYVQEVHGEHEVGGTSVLYISDISLDFLAWQPDLDDRPLPERTWASLKKVLPMILGMGGLMAGTYWIIGRRMKLAAEAGPPSAPGESQAGDSTNTTQGDRDDHD